MRTYIFICFVMLLAFSSKAQTADPAKTQDKIEAIRVQYIAERLQLTPEEAKWFWPLYNQYKKDIEELKKKYSNVSGLETKDPGPDPANEAEADKLLQELISFRQQQVDLMRKYTDELKKVLPAKKVMLYYKAEAEIKRKLIKILTQKQKQGGQVPRPLSEE